MAPSAGHLHKLVIRNIKLIKAAWRNATNNLQSRAATVSRLQLQPLPVRAGTQYASNSAAAYARAKGRYYTTRSAAREFSTSSTRQATLNKSSLPKSRFSFAINSSTGRAPFANTLRPNLTGGAFPRSAGGYGLGSGRAGGARYFSHGPAAPTQVIQNVSQAVRAFFISGHKAQFDGVDPKTGEKRYRAVTTLQEDTRRKIASLPKATPGSYIDFSVNPTITAFTPLSSVAGYSPSSSSGSVNDCRCHLNSSGLLDVLSSDFSRALKDLVAVLSDLKALCTLGDLPITHRASSTLRVHFAGCDAETVENLCAELGITRGVVNQDPDFDAYVGTDIALLFPFAPSEAPTETSPMKPAPPEFANNYYWEDEPLFPGGHGDAFSTRSNSDLDLFELDQELPSPTDIENMWFSSPETRGDSRSFHSQPQFSSAKSADLNNSPLEYQSFEGIYKFIELCDAAKR